MCMYILKYTNVQNITLDFFDSWIRNFSNVSMENIKFGMVLDSFKTRAWNKRITKPKWQNQIRVQL